jgi:hypothetical protein
MRFIGAVEEMITCVKSLRTLPVDEKYIQRDYVEEEFEQRTNLEEKQEKFIVFNIIFLSLSFSLIDWMIFTSYSRLFWQ